MKIPENKHSQLFINGKVWNDGPTFTEAFGIRNGKIDFTGTNSDADKIKNNYDKVINIKNRLVLPGLCDGHVHFVYGSLTRKQIDCTGINTLEELEKIIHAYVKAHPEAAVLIGGNLNIEKLGIDLPSLHENPLDKLVLDKPIFIANYDYHSGLCNSGAMKVSGLIENPGQFSNEEVPKNSSGQPAGLVKERAFGYLFDNLPKPTLAEKVNAAAEMIGVLHSYGITSVSDITVPTDLEVYKMLNASGKLKIRINSYIPLFDFNNTNEFKSFTKEIHKELFSIKGYKGFYDGALGSETASFSENYKNKSYSGYKTDMAESGMLQRYAEKIDNSGGQLMIHAIGDKAVSGTLDICEALIKINGKRDRRFRIEHAQHINENDFRRFKGLGVIVSVQPLHMIYDMKIAKAQLSDKIFNRTHNYKNLIDKDVPLVFGTDFPIVEINPFRNIQTAATRTIEGEVFAPENRIDLNYCIKAYTLNNAYTSFNEDYAGSITTGKFADFVIMQDDIFNMPVEEISSSRVWRTYFNGEQVYSSES